MDLDFRDIVTIGYYLLAIATVLFVIADNRSPHKTLSWILVLITLPIGGLILYFFFGHNFRKERLFEGKKKLDIKSISRIVTEQSLELDPEKVKLGLASRKTKMINLLLRNNKARLTQFNRIDILSNGKETYDSILDALKGAQEHIHLEYYIFEEGEIATEIANVLIEKASKGVEVRFMYDSVGSWDLSGEFIENLERNGVKVAECLPVRFLNFTSKLNYRNHRKIVVIDGKIGFLGGLNISDKYVKVDDGIGMVWRDTHLRLEGESVRDLQLIFLTDWYFVTRDFIEDEERYFPSCSITQQTNVQILPSGPDTEFKAVMNALFIAITSAEKYIRIVTPYFIPNESLLNALRTAAGSGVDVQIILPGISDSKIVQLSSQSYFEDLLENGVKIFQYHGGFVHSKIMIVDGVMATVGTANMDIRSFEQNMEVNALIYDPEVTSRLEILFEQDLNHCRPIHLRPWKGRKTRVKLAESFCRLLAPLM